jgi:solute carrier family 13 (sodium-dependent dicarboxylate transporter), member 2/3/5
MKKFLHLDKFHMTLKGLIGLILALIAIIVSCCLPATEDLTSPAIKTLGLLAAFLIVLITEALPVIITSLLFVALMPVIGVTTNLSQALVGFSDKVVYFTLASFGLALALTKLPLSNRFLKWMLRHFGKSVKSSILAIMVTTCIVSSIISNVPTCAVFMSVALSFLNLYKNEDDKKKTGRALMIAVPVASMIGGIMTPAGSSINLIAMGILEQAGYSISFVQWMLAGTPLAIVLLPLAWVLICWVYKPVPVSKEEIQNFVNGIEIPAKMSWKEIATLIITGGMFILWVASSWVKQLDVMVIAILGCVLLLFPGIEAISVKTFIQDNSWDAFFLVGCVLSIGEALKVNGVDAYVSSLIPSLQINVFLLIGLTALIVFVSLIVIPVATSLIKILGAPLMALALASGVNPILVMLTASIAACNCYLLPLDTVPLITYSQGYYSMTDMAKSTALLQVAIVLLCAGWIPLVGMMLGLI